MVKSKTYWNTPLAVTKSAIHIIHNLNMYAVKKNLLLQSTTCLLLRHLVLGGQHYINVSTFKMKEKSMFAAFLGEIFYSRAWQRSACYRCFTGCWALGTIVWALGPLAVAS